MSASFDIAAFAYAHRGLWGRNVSENSLAAFAAAAAAGVGCELDVRITGNGKLAVFHDTTLQRMCNDPARIDERTLAEIMAKRLPDGSHIPSLEQALTAMAGMPVLIEIKVDYFPESEHRNRYATKPVVELLTHSSAPAAVMSFDEPTVWSLLAARDIDPAFDRQIGQLIDPLSELGVDGVKAKAERAIKTGVDYLAPHISSLETVAAVASGLPLVTWTVRDPAQLGHARVTGAAPIFEGFPADLAKPRRTPI